MGEVKTYTGKEGVTHKIRTEELQWIKENAKLLDVSVYEIVWQAVHNRVNSYNDPGDDINPLHIFWFLCEKGDFPELDQVTEINDGLIELPREELLKYLDKKDVDNISKDREIHFDRFFNTFRQYYQRYTTPSGGSFQEMYDALIIMHRICGIKMDVVLTWFFLTQYNSMTRYNDMDYIIDYCHTYADDPKLFE